jgi:5-oxoprolinase (ATP-hydrolysing) subunit C
MSLTVVEPGLYSLLVDAGRPTARHLGMPLGGAADHAAFAFANHLLGNSADSVALELTMSGPTLRAERPTACAMFGAPFHAAIANKGRVEPGGTFNLDAGDVLKIGGTPCGVRGYLAVVDGFDTPTILQSRSALEPISVGQSLMCAESHVRGRALPFAMLPCESVLRVLPGPQHDWFFEANTFFDSQYEVLPASNRMGVRLRGAKLERRPGELVSEAVAPGAVQITNDGQPIVLGVDGQTIGGYPKIAHVIRADCDRLAQLRPGSSVVFRLVSEDDAQRAWDQRIAQLHEWEVRLAVTLNL